MTLEPFWKGTALALSALALAGGAACGEVDGGNSGTNFQKCTMDSECASGQVCIAKVCRAQSVADPDAGRDAGPGAERDADPVAHDGSVRIVEVGTWSNASPPPECIAGLPGQLPDCDPSDTLTQGIDCDGDGVPGYIAHSCLLSNAQLGPAFGGPFDCAPDDPVLRHWVRRDADGDGFGAGVSFCAGPTIPEGYVPVPDFYADTDCDDSSSEIHPRAEEAWGDGIDADCENGEFPSCDAIRNGEPFQGLIPSSVCEGSLADAFLSEIALCGGRCPTSGSLWGFVANAGKATLAGPVTIRWNDNKGDAGSLQVADGPLAPGEMSPPFEVPIDMATEVEIFVDAQDCDPNNHRRLLSFPSGNQSCI